MSSSPAAGAIGAAGAVIAAALVAQAAASMADAWPELVLAALGAALGAGIAINSIVARDLDPPQPAPAGAPDPTPTPRRLALLQQLSTAVVVSCIVAAGWTEDPLWWMGAAAMGLAWAWTLWQLAWRLDTSPARRDRSVYPAAFQIAGLTIALWLIYGALAADTPWLWRPERWDDFQGPIWAVVLELAGLPMTLVAAGAAGATGATGATGAVGRRTETSG